MWLSAVCLCMYLHSYITLSLTLIQSPHITIWQRVNKKTMADDPRAHTGMNAHWGPWSLAILATAVSSGLAPRPWPVAIKGLDTHKVTLVLLVFMWSHFYFSTISTGGPGSVSFISCSIVAPLPRTSWQSGRISQTRIKPSGQCYLSLLHPNPNVVSILASQGPSYFIWLQICIIPSSLKQQEAAGKKSTQVCNLQSKFIQQKDSSSGNSGIQSIKFGGKRKEATPGHHTSRCIICQARGSGLRPRLAIWFQETGGVFSPWRRNAAGRKRETDCCPPPRVLAINPYIPGDHCRAKYIINSEFDAW